MENDRTKTACFTGHRPDKIGGYYEENPTALKVKENLRKMITKAKEQGYTTFITGMAMGVDQWAAEIVLEDPDLTLIAAIPCEGQESKWRPSAQDKYRELLDKIPQKVVLAKKYHAGVMHNRNEWMVDNSSLVLSVWNGTPGGTSSCIKYARFDKLKIVNYDHNSDTVEEMVSFSENERSDQDK